VAPEKQLTAERTERGSPGAGAVDRSSGGTEALRALGIIYLERRAWLPNWEIRYWEEQPEGAGMPSHWVQIAFAHTREEARVVAAALYEARGWPAEVWCIPERRVYDAFPETPPGEADRVTS
jgi:hypothetical protein